MTQEEALEYFKSRKDICLSDECQQAYDMAISALEQEPNTWIEMLTEECERLHDMLDKEPCDALVSQMVQYIKAHDTPSLIELVIKAIKETE